MKLWIFSDLHRNFEDWSPGYVPDADVCVVAGDVGEGLVKSMHWLQKHVGAHMPVVFVAGNHEFYRHGMKESFAEAREVNDCPDVRLLEDEAVVIYGMRFLGCTLWTDYAAMEHRGNRASAMHMARQSMNDHRKIAWVRDPWERFTPSHAYRKHATSRAFLTAALAQPFDGPSVVVTHHAPHRHSIAPVYAKDLLTAAYVSDLSDLIEAGKPDLWVHGHMHTSADYTAGATRVVCNPRGYGLENVYHFVPDLTVEVPEPTQEMKP